MCVAVDVAITHLQFGFCALKKHILTFHVLFFHILANIWRELMRRFKIKQVAKKYFQHDCKGYSLNLFIILWVRVQHCNVVVLVIFGELIESVKAYICMHVAFFGEKKNTGNDRLKYKCFR